MIAYSVRNNESNCTEDDVEKLLKSSSGISNQSFSFTRFLLLTLLGYFQDGLQYRELNSALGVTIGKLNADLKKLEKLHYIKKCKLKIENKTIRYYTLTEEGKSEFLALIEWVNSAGKIVKGNNTTCQTVIK